MNREVESQPEKIAIAGGIGCGKSVVSRILRVMGYPVFDCDMEARRIMDLSPEIHERLNAEIHPEAVCNGRINRSLISKVVFEDKMRLDSLNRIVHGEVRRELRNFFEKHKGCDAVFVETAILYQSDIDKMVDKVWEITAPVELRVERIIRRNGISKEDALARINAQKFSPSIPHSCVTIINNDGVTPILSQIESLLSKIKY